MCIAIYLALMTLLWLYSDFILESYALSTSSGEEWMVVALGWEILPALWPVILFMMVLASAVTFFLVRYMSSEASR